MRAVPEGAGAAPAVKRRQRGRTVTSHAFTRGLRSTQAGTGARPWVLLATPSRPGVFFPDSVGQGVRSPRTLRDHGCKTHLGPGSVLDSARVKTADGPGLSAGAGVGSGVTGSSNTWLRAWWAGKGERLASAGAGGEVRGRGAQPWREPQTRPAQARGAGRPPRFPEPMSPPGRRRRHRVFRWAPRRQTAWLVLF